MLREFTCRICNKTAEAPVFRIREMFFGMREAFNYAQCPSCACLQILEVPGDMARFYPKDYYSYVTINETSPITYLKGIFRRLRDRSILLDRGVFGRIIQHLRPPDFPLELLKRVGPLKEISILDVGCGSGMLLYYLKEAGIGNVLGIDPFIEHDIEYRSGLRIMKRSITELQDLGKKFDLVMFNHSLEHMPDPDSILKATDGVLADQGTVLIRTPTVDSFAWEHYREDWVQCDAPRHLYLHSRASLDILAVRAGMMVTEVVYDSDALQLWGSEQYQQDIPLISERSYKYGLRHSIFSKEQINDFHKKAEKLNEEGKGDQAAFYLKRRAWPQHTS
jgi:2-polyprenyl-3-methyl-5-hydroxy-6-metoxy-1,4-benzoquinol methylase